MEVERGAWAEINLDAVANNVREAKRLLKPTTKLCAVVKADAYGHGAVPVASEAVRSGADFSPSPCRRKASSCATRASTSRS